MSRHVHIVCMNRNLICSCGSYITGKAGKQENKYIKKMSDSDKVLLRDLMWWVKMVATFFNWIIIDLQSCNSFRCTSRWFSFVYIGRDWAQEEKGTTEDEMEGWHHWLDGRESQWTPRVGDGQGGLACWNSCDRKESDTTERLILYIYIYKIFFRFFSIMV